MVYNGKNLLFSRPDVRKTKLSSIVELDIDYYTLSFEKAVMAIPQSKVRSKNGLVDWLVWTFANKVIVGGIRGRYNIEYGENSGSRSKRALMKKSRRVYRTPDFVLTARGRNWIEEAFLMEEKALSANAEAVVRKALNLKYTAAMRKYL
jgi:hypothetical protein